MRLLGLAVAALVLVAGCGYGGVPAAEAPPVNGDPLPVPAAAQVAEPASLTIPALGVTDNIVPVGLCTKKAPPRCEAVGEMELPDVTETGWYREAPKPGGAGRAIYASHVDWKGTPGAFKHLPNLKPGDIIRSVDAAGAEVEFIVYDTRQIPKTQFNAVTVPLLFGASTGREVALVTCSGVVTAGNYADNTIVRARAA
jgi:hypothetical protein